MNELTWIKSTRSQGCGHCVELAALPTGVGVRDSHNPGPVLTITAADLRAITRSPR